ncbi:MAG: type II toxin-antitoxin system RelE/ParE family toxin [bacterium]
MVFTVLLHPKAAKALKKIEKPMRSKIIRKLREMEESPERSGKRLKYSNFWTIRIGDYRAIYEIYRDKNQLVILFIEHRKKVYSDFSKIF